MLNDLCGTIGNIYEIGFSNTKILKVIQKGKGENEMKEFKYKNNVYIINDDLIVKETVTLYNENGEPSVIYSIEPGNYVAKKEYCVSKGYYTIEKFETEEEANAFIDKILKEIGD